MPTRKGKHSDQMDIRGSELGILKKNEPQANTRQTRVWGTYLFRPFLCTPSVSWLYSSDGKKKISLEKTRGDLQTLFQ